MPTEASARVIADSINQWDDRLVTMEIVLWRPLLAEMNAHRAMARNSASSRAIPITKQLEWFDRDGPAYPISWPAEQPGMQGGDELEGDDLAAAQALFEDCYMTTRALVDRYLRLNPDKATRLHKSCINRLLEPWMWQTIVCSFTDDGFENFLWQRSTRYSTGAQAEIRATADAMADAWDNSEPTFLGLDDWHTPYIQPDELHLPVRVRAAISAARCARVSYLTQNGVRDIQEDLNLYRRLMTATPRHWSPLEHVATPSAEYEAVHGCFEGWHQLRHFRDQAGTPAAENILKEL